MKKQLNSVSGLLNGLEQLFLHTVFGFLLLTAFLRANPEQIVVAGGIVGVVGSSYV